MLKLPEHCESGVVLFVPGSGGSERQWVALPESALPDGMAATRLLGLFRASLTEDGAGEKAAELRTFRKTVLAQAAASSYAPDRLLNKRALHLRKARSAHVKFVAGQLCRLLEAVGRERTRDGATAAVKPIVAQLDADGRSVAVSVLRALVDGLAPDGGAPTDMAALFGGATKAAAEFEAALGRLRSVVTSIVVGDGLDAKDPKLVVRDKLRSRFLFLVDQLEPHPQPTAVVEPTPSETATTGEPAMDADKPSTQ